MRRRIINNLLFVGVLLAGSCSQNEVLFPIRPSLPAGTVALPEYSLKAMEGIYKLSSGGNGLGTEFVCKVSRHKVSFFSNTEGASLILDAGMDPTDSSINFAGYWRYAEDPRQDVVFFKIDNAHGILVDSIPTGTVLTGNYYDNQVKSDLKIAFDRGYSKYVNDYLNNRGNFVVLGHHGIQTNANPPFLENSLNAVKHCEDYGATGIEVDVRLTKDNVPILIHDADLNLRVVLKNGILGKVNEFNFSTIYNFVRLRDGQRIPSLQEALDAAIDSTGLEYIWLDIKGDPDVFKYLEPIVRPAVDRARDLGRKITIMSGLPSDDVIKEFKKQPTYADLPMLCELELQKVIDNNCQFWGPRFTEGTHNADVQSAHEQGIKAFTWTLNSDIFIKDFLADGDFDGMITDYPAYAIYRFYTHP